MPLAWLRVIISDTLATVVDPAFAGYLTLSSIGAWLAAVGYAFQLYFDFCGYSGMAVGLGLMFGLRIPWNFNSPYKALDPSDFWRRWHISLSSCLRDYLYIPLGGNRHGEWQASRNLMITMLIGGLWHGANWTFVAWGAYHGLWLVVYRRISRQWDAMPGPVRQAMTFLGVLVGWVLFRATNFTMAAVLLRRMFVPTSGEIVSRALPFSAVLVAAWWACQVETCGRSRGGRGGLPGDWCSRACGAVFAVPLQVAALHSYTFSFE